MKAAVPAARRGPTIIQPTAPGSGEGGRGAGRDWAERWGGKWERVGGRWERLGRERAERGEAISRRVHREQRRTPNHFVEHVKCARRWAALRAAWIERHAVHKCRRLSTALVKPRASRSMCRP